MSEKTKYFNFNLCAACGGACCKRSAGIYAPEDLGTVTAEKIFELLAAGKHGIDWWEGDVLDRPEHSSTYYLRPRHRNEPAIKGSWGGVCVNLTEKGCSLPENEKPFQCKKLIPEYDNENKEYVCDTLPKDKANKKSMIVRWAPYQKELTKAIELFNQSEYY